MGLYKLCQHKRRDRDRCEHRWWGSFRGVRVSLTRWANREVTTKAEAYAVLDELRRALRKGTFDPRGLETAPPGTALTFREFATIYIERHVRARKLSHSESANWRLGPLLDRFGDRLLADIRTADVEDFIADMRKPRTLHGRTHVLSNASINRTIELLRHMLNWAVGREYLEKTPFRRGTESLIKNLREDNVRRRRISADEEQRLLAAAPAYLKTMIITALDTGMRRGEMLALRFTDIDQARGLITLRGETTKSGKTRLVPISTQRLRAVIEWLRIDAEGQQKADETLVFSNEIGEPLPLFHDAWLRTVLKAHGVTPRLAASLKYKGLARESKDAFRKIDLRWHDLRHEYASRLVERGVPLAQVRDLLGHASIITTERYDTQKLENLQAAVLKLESGKTFDATPPGGPERSAPQLDKHDGLAAPKRRAAKLASRRRNKVSSFFHEKAKVSGIDDQKIDQATEPKSEDDNDLGEWLGGRDSNPDNVVQSHVSYR